MESDLLSLSHNIEGFPFSPTRNSSEYTQGNVNKRMLVDTLRNNLTVTAVVRINGEVAGLATEHEILTPDPNADQPQVDSAWLIMLNVPGLKGFLAVKQNGDSSGASAMAAKVMQDPEVAWADKWHRFLSTAGDTRVQMAVGDLGGLSGRHIRKTYLLEPYRF